MPTPNSTLKARSVIMVASPFIVLPPYITLKLREVKLVRDKQIEYSGWDDHSLPDQPKKNPLEWGWGCGERKTTREVLSHGAQLTRY
ncbi:hypothetical protein ACFLV0_02910 [Chloroflexota bacterium]